LSLPSPTVIEGLRVAVPAANLIGESPVWSVKEQALYWADVEARCVQRLHRDAVTRWEVPEPIGSLGLRCSGGLITATRSGFVFLDTANGQLTAISDPEADLPGNRFNDGKVDRNGRFWAGTKNIANSPEPSGSLYRLDADLRAYRITGGLSCTNGIAWSPDNRTLYVCDTWLRRIYRYAFDPNSGTVGRRKLFAELSDKQGFPDGLTVDAEGCIWNAHYDGWCITRYDPDGRVRQVLNMPVQHVTSVTFGGSQLRTLYVTSASMRLSEAARRAQPLAGHVFAFEPGVTGLAECCFAG
jgi:sugar lactone lactonase YvrE